MIKDLKFKILICLNSSIIEHETPLQKTPHIFPICLQNLEIFATLEALSEGLQMFFEL
jgi:hypothetical protein